MADLPNRASVVKVGENFVWDYRPITGLEFRAP
jgi:hypothetical protein